MSNSYANAISHCAYCGLIALNIARNERFIKNNRISANRFLSDWARKAIKEARFPAIVFPELASIASLGHKNASVNNLEKTLTIIWTEWCNEKQRVESLPKEMNVRIEHAFKELGSLGWKAVFGYDQDWSKGGFQPNGLKNIFVIKDHKELFNENGQLTEDYIHIFLVLPPTGNKEAKELKMQAVDTLYKHGILIFSPQTGKNGKCHQFMFEVWPRNKKPNEQALMPSKM